MNLYFNTDIEPDTLVVFYIKCSDCNEVIIDTSEFYVGTKESNQFFCEKHTRETQHENFNLGSVVRSFVCGDCGAEWLYKGEISAWQRQHHRATGHTYFGFGPVTKEMYE